VVHQAVDHGGCCRDVRICCGGVTAAVSISCARGVTSKDVGDFSSYFAVWLANRIPLRMRVFFMQTVLKFLFELGIITGCN
jgi:hypothetical protein